MFGTTGHLSYDNVETQAFGHIRRDFPPIDLFGRVTKLAQVIESMAEVLCVAELVTRLVLSVANFSTTLSTSLPFKLLGRWNFPDACSHIAIAFLVAHHAPFVFQILVFF